MFSRFVSLSCAQSREVSPQKLTIRCFFPSVLSDKVVLSVVTHSFCFMLCQSSFLSTVINVKQLILFIYCLYNKGNNIIFCHLWCFVPVLISHLCFDSELFITFLVGYFLGAVGRKRIFLFGRFIACLNTYLHAKI